MDSYMRPELIAMVKALSGGGGGGGSSADTAELEAVVAQLAKTGDRVYYPGEMEAGGVSTEGDLNNEHQKKVSRRTGFLPLIEDEITVYTNSGITAYIRLYDAGYNILAPVGPGSGDTDNYIKINSANTPLTLRMIDYHADAVYFRFIYTCGEDESKVDLLTDGCAYISLGKTLLTESDISGLRETVQELEESISGGALVLTPERIQQIVADGKARDSFSVGDVIYIPWTNYTPSTPVVYQFPFVVVHIGDAYDQNDVLHKDALWLMAMYAEPEEIIFDAAEDTPVNLTEEPNALEGWYYWGVTGTDYTALNLAAGDAIPTTYDSVHRCGINHVNVLRYGYNRWKDSAYRQWLNSKAAKNENWWESQHTGDVAPAATYTNKPGWLYGFEDRWLNVIKPVKVQTACNTVTDGGVTDVTYDRFFLPSVEQMYGEPQAAGVEGDYWEYWKNETGMDVPSNGSPANTKDARKIPSVVNYPRGSAVDCRLRSANRGHANAVWTVYAGGSLRYYHAANAYRSLPACVIY